MTGQSVLWNGRVLCWFSCGAASAVAAKMAVDRFGADWPVEVLYCDTLAFEHPDNARFLADVSRWVGREIKLLRSEKFRDIFEVFERERYLNGRHGAPCTRALKRAPRLAYQEPWDRHVFGYTAEEQARIDRFEAENAGLACEWVLRDEGITKADCYRIVAEAGIELPAMYRLGYRNNNCIGCVKGKAGYWNKIRVDFPDAFARMAAMERQLGFALIRLKGTSCFLDELPPDAGRYQSEPDIECGPRCISLPREDKHALGEAV